MINERKMVSSTSSVTEGSKRGVINALKTVECCSKTIQSVQSSTVPVPET